MNKFKSFMNSVNWAAPVLLIPVVIVMHLAGLITLSWLPGPSPRQAQSVADNAGILFALCLGNLLLAGPALLLPRLGKLQQRIVVSVIALIVLITLVVTIQKDSNIFMFFWVFNAFALNFLTPSNQPAPASSDGSLKSKR